MIDYQNTLRWQLERSPGAFMGRTYPALVEIAREEIACFLGSEPNHLAFVGNATSGVNAVLRSLGWQAGDEIVTTDHGYLACRNAAAFLERARGVRVRTVALEFPDISGYTVTERVLAAVTERTRLALLDHVTSPTALVLPVAQLAGRLKERGVKVLIDGAHAPGMLPLDLERLGQQGVTYYAGNLHKWCCAPKGAAFLWVAPTAQEGLSPTVISHGFSSTKARGKFLEEFDWCGTFDPTAWLAAPRSLKLLEGLFPDGWDGLRQRCNALLLEGRAVVAQVLPEQSLAPVSMLGQIASLELPPSNQDEVNDELYDLYGIDSMVTTWNGRSLLRLSAAPYNEISDYHAMAAALRGVGASRGWPDGEKETENRGA